MKLNVFFIINAIVALIFGLALALVPAQTLNIYGLTMDEAGLLVARLFGAALLGYAALTWLARTQEEDEARHAIVPALFVTNGIGFIIALIGQLGGLVNMVGWVNVVIYAFFTLVYMYFEFMHRPATSQRASGA